MKRIFLPIALMLSLILTAGNAGNSSVEAKFSHPSAISPSSEFSVRVNLKKGKQSEGCVLQVFLPDGFSASPLESSGAIFSIENKAVRFVWPQLQQEEVNVSFRVKCGNVSKGLKKLEAIFTAVEDGRSVHHRLSSSLFYVGNEFTIDAKQSAMNDYTMIRRIKESSSGVTDGFRVSLEVSGVVKPGKGVFTDLFPSGYLVEVNEANNAVFSRDNKSLSFTWEEVPLQDNWTFSYTLIPSKGVDPKAVPQIEGMLIIENELSYSAIKPFLKQEEEEKRRPVLTASASPAQKNAESVKSSGTTSPSVKLQSPVQVNRTYFKVQIAATQKSPARDNNFFRMRYQVQHQVDLYEHEGWRKYCVGNFENYNQAKHFLNSDLASVKGAFVVAYRDGSRIHVREALQYASMYHIIPDELTASAY
ncbi:MAG: hypothetical protein DWQ44_13100 [Bacteroidetes bacterium]|nr:MAG: hypothetical protein DWQ33_13485 [Bacteroidota bacterium]REK05794.1 MAG: hypothetical protein DWQ39_05150 [Bacteroidota bacterium]REK31901.1 MAG: hypothetical protein DWQ44_13100 [Bacteroidota bacterium]REK49966.1 MAG: hypothetical protein DWQ48_05320 [Bacteroidota bacterium]